MSKRRPKRPFETEAPNTHRSESLVDTSSGVFGFFKDYGVRETIESIIVAVVLALMFRAYEAEAFIIPTGSMAPSLQGQHMDVICDQCGYQYRAGASRDSSTTAPENRARVTKTYCPICRHGMVMQSKNPNHVSNNGDRILVNKFVYDFQDPERFDVIVFKNPNNGKQNYIKRLVGLPGDKLLIENGDIYNFVADANGKLQKEIVRKPYDKVPVMLQLIDDTNHIATQFKLIDWPVRWAEWNSPGTNWQQQETGGQISFVNPGESNELNWLRYRHLVPRSRHDEYVIEQSQLVNRTVDTVATDWEEIDAGQIPKRIKPSANEYSAGSLIRDYYEYNDRNYRYANSNLNANPRMRNSALSKAAQWVGDLGVEFEIEIGSDSGSVAFDLVEGGVHFQCLVDVATGQAEIRTQQDQGEIVFDTAGGKTPTAVTPINGKGSYAVRYVHVDDMLYLWINGRYIEFDGSSYVRNAPGRPQPRYSKQDPGDAEPVGIGAQNCQIKVNRIKVFRDIYYTAPLGSQEDRIVNETNLPYLELVTVYENPELWKSPAARRIFQRPVSNKSEFDLDAGQYFPMGDNSPASQDARIWDGPNFVDEEFLIGRAMFIYWPHSLNSPIKYFPNFKRMGFIR